MMDPSVASVVTKRRRISWSQRKTGFLDLSTGRGICADGSNFRAGRSLPTLADVLQCVPRDLKTLHLVGEPAGNFLRWVTIPPPGEITVENGGHYIPNNVGAILRFVMPNGVKLSIHRSEAWGADFADELDAAAAWKSCESELKRVDPGAFLATTPSTTGRLLLQRVIPDGLPVLSLADQDFIRSTAGQGRIEYFSPPFPRPKPARIHGYDMRAAYVGCCNSLGSGPIQRDRLSDFDPYRPGRYFVQAHVPRDWDHVGILPLKTADGWCWPSAHGQTFQTWVTGAELLQASRFGWSFKIIERELMSAARPLDRWARGLAAAIERMELAESDTVRAMLRSVALHTIGALWGARSRITCQAPLSDLTIAPPNMVGTMEISNGIGIWTESRPASWPELSHPEWAAAIWARCRTRVLSFHERGALHLASKSIVAIRTDAIYTTAAPQWPDNGRVGCMRHVSTSARTPWPVSAADLLVGRNA